MKLHLRINIGDIVYVSNLKIIKRIMVFFFKYNFYLKSPERIFFPTIITINYFAYLLV